MKRRKGMKIARAVYALGMALNALLVLGALIARHEELHGPGTFDALW